MDFEETDNPSLVVWKRPFKTNAFTRACEMYPRHILTSNYREVSFLVWDFLQWLKTLLPAWGDLGPVYMKVTPPWNVYIAKFDPGWEGYPVWQTGLSALAGHPTYHVNVTKLKWAIIWTGGLPHLSGLPHLPGVSHLHVNRPLVITLVATQTMTNGKHKL